MSCGEHTRTVGPEDVKGVLGSPGVFWVSSFKKINDERMQNSVCGSVCGNVVNGVRVHPQVPW